MKRRSNSSLHPSVQFGQLVERRNCPFIREDEGKGATFGGVGGLALCAGFWLGHGSLRAQLGGGSLQRSHVRGVGLLSGGQLAGDLIGADAGDGFDKGGHRVVAAGFGVHGLLRSVTVGGSSHITSDASTTVRRVVCRLLGLR